MIALMYHDIVDEGCADESGFPGRDAARYKVPPAQFVRHLDAIERLDRVALTFDDGGISAMRAADELEKRGRKGSFFVSCNYIGKPRFLDCPDIVELWSRGHVVGSHSCSHPLRMGHCTRAQLVDEWTRSRAILQSIVGADIRVASIPGGDFAAAVAETAEEAGFTTLFTSEPTRFPVHHGRLTMPGRYTIQRSTSAAAVAALARGAWTARAGQTLSWTGRKALKRVAGARYLRIRRLLLGHGDEVQWGDGTI